MNERVPNRNNPRSRVNPARVQRTTSGRVITPEVTTRKTSPMGRAHASHVGMSASSVPTSRAPRQTSMPPKRKGPWRIVLAVALFVFLVSAGALAYLGFSYWQGQQTYDRLEEAVEVSESAELADFKVDWEALSAINPDVVAWIYMPGTVINYPVVHRDGDDSYYLTHNFNNETTGEFGAEYGAIMLSGVNSGDFSDDVNFIYGHHMSNGMMFACLQEFEDPSIFNANRDVYLLTPEGNYLLRSFSIIRTPGSDTTVIRPNFGSDTGLVNYVQEKMEQSLVAPDPMASAAEDISQVFALITCDSSNNSYRYIPFFEVVDFYSFADGTYLTGKSLVDYGDVVGVGEAVVDRVS